MKLHREADALFRPAGKEILYAKGMKIGVVELQYFHGGR
jgi:hypothetical protein